VQALIGLSGIMKTKNYKKMIRIIALVMMMGCILYLFSGCGFAPGGANNNLCLEKDEDTIVNLKGQEFKGFGVSFDRLNATSDEYGSGVDPKTQGVTYIRDAAILIYESIFGEDSYQWANDNFRGSNRLGSGFKLDPTLLIHDITDKATFDIASAALGDVSSAMQGFAVAILIAVWAMGFISQIVNEKFTMETLLKTLMQLLCGVVIIFEAPTLVGWMLDAGNAIVDSFSADNDLISKFSGVSDSIINEMDNGIISFSMAIDIINLIVAPIGTIWIDYGPIIAIVMMAFPLAMMIVCAYKIVSIMIMRMLELTVRIIFAPIPLAFGAQNGFSQDTIRYLRGVMACAAQPALMIAGALCVDAIATCILHIFGMSAASEASGWIGCIAMGLSFLVLSSYLGQTKQLAQEIIAR
jgi:hypothetical protein